MKKNGVEFPARAFAYLLRTDVIDLNKFAKNINSTAIKLKVMNFESCGVVNFILYLLKSIRYIFGDSMKTCVTDAITFYSQCLKHKNICIHSLYIKKISTKKFSNYFDKNSEDAALKSHYGKMIESLLSIRVTQSKMGKKLLLK